MKKLSKRRILELRKLHKLIVHEQCLITDHKEWYRLARKETKWLQQIGLIYKPVKVCFQGCGF